MSATFTHSRRSARARVRTTFSQVPFAAGRVLFRAAAGRRQGFGHLVRCRSLAKALGVRPLVAVRGSATAHDVALGLGCDVVRGGAAQLIAALSPDVLVVDDPNRRHARRWIIAARRAGVVVASVHDLGLGCLDADLVIDGSVESHLVGTGDRGAIGPHFAIVDPTLRQFRRAAAERRGVVVSLGGGPRVETAWSIATEIARRASGVSVRVVGGFVAKGPPLTMREASPSNVIWVGASNNLADEIGRAQVAVVGGGVSLYEACALGTAAVGVPVVASQRPTVAAFVAHGAALGAARSAPQPRRVAEDALTLLRQSRLRTHLARTGRRLIDGRGAIRAANAIARLSERRS